MPSDAGSPAPPQTFFPESPEQLVSLERLAEMSGLEFIRGMAEGRLPAPPIARLMDFALHEVAEGRVVFRGRPRFEHYNPIGGVHGGWFGTLLDSCMACAVQTTLPKGFGYTTLEYRVNIVRPLFEDSEAVLARGDVLHAGKRTAAAEGKLLGEDSGKLYAFGTTTCLVMPLS
ncbi:MAG: PaaI family thioesterase [Pseudomonadota bacterium]